MLSTFALEPAYDESDICSDAIVNSMQHLDEMRTEFSVAMLDEECDDETRALSEAGVAFSKKATKCLTTLYALLHDVNMMEA